MNYSSEDLTEDLNYSEQIQYDANERAQQRAIDCLKDPRKFTVADIEAGQCVTRRWCGLRTRSAVLMQTNKKGFA